MHKSIKDWHDIFCQGSDIANGYFIKFFDDADLADMFSIEYNNIKIIQHH